MKVCNVRYCKSCTQEVSEEIEAKPRLVETQFPAVENLTHRSIPEAMTPNNA